MGNFNSTFNSTSIQETQIAQTNQQCFQNNFVSLDDTTITIINSTVGDISLTNSLQINNLDCILNATTINAVNNSISNIVQNVNSSFFPFSAQINSNSTTNIISVNSFQEAINNQMCNQNVSSEAGHNSLTIIDSVTGNILIANSSAITSQSCNLAASTSQTATNEAKTDTSNENSTECLGFDCCMIVPILLGIVALPIISRLVKPPGGSGEGGGGEESQELLGATTSAIIANTLTELKGGGGRPPPRSMPMSATKAPLPLRK